MLRRTAIKSIVLAALGVVGIRKKPELFVVETPDGIAMSNSDNRKSHYMNHNDGITRLNFPAPGHWKLARIVFEKVDG